MRIGRPRKRAKYCVRTYTEEMQKICRSRSPIFLRHVDAVCRRIKANTKAKRMEAIRIARKELYGF